MYVAVTKDFVLVQNHLLIQQTFTEHQPSA